MPDEDRAPTRSLPRTLRGPAFRMRHESEERPRVCDMRGGGGWGWGGGWDWGSGWPRKPRRG